MELVMTRAATAGQTAVSPKTLAHGRVEPGGRKAGSIDVDIGQRMRRLRNNKQLSQEELAARIGISCQQLQKYESGANRISASRLVQVADALNVEISRFLRDNPTKPASDQKLEAANDRQAGVPDAREIMTLLTAFAGIGNQASREKVIEMATFLAGLEQGAAQP
jgi:transcriptional regulator with XRE-family HTH domain